MITGQIERTKGGAAKVRHALYRRRKGETWVTLTSELFKDILDNQNMPRPYEQLDNLVLWLGENQPTMGIGIQVDDPAVAAVGAEDMASVGFLTSQAIDSGLVNGEVISQIGGGCFIPSAQLTINGWKRFDELRRGKSSSRMAFMAMQYGDVTLDRVYAEHFRRAVAATGLDLKRLDESQPAGLIDDRLRVEIRLCRFVIADMTHQNKGVYWEAGYAEGLGKPVIYTCRKDVFDDKCKGPHFDTNHHLTVVWSEETLASAEKKLMAVIRSTLPDEATLVD